jgi:monofunctional glycosyltransferase
MGHVIFVLSTLSVLAAIFVLWVGWNFYHDEFPEVSTLKTQFPVVRYQGPKRPPTVSLQKLRPSSWVTIAEISRPAVGAVIVSEDWAFYQHEGYDANQIKEAIKEDLEKGHFARGASTITQQVVRNVYLDKDKNLWRKMKELILAIRLEDQVGKRKILETYLNIAEWGEGLFGIGAAARHYFNKHPSELTAKEGAFLAMLLPSPKRYSQSFRSKQLTEYARKTIRSILDKMTQAQYLTAEEKILQQMEPLSFEATLEGNAPPEAPEESSESSDLGEVSEPRPDQEI